ncbi:MAG: hypothetical protein GDA67_16080 [Nitrospira sp. CR1.3]|nr:hypothetical protein [Nitrospira sp. CR1.3]
MNLAHPLLIIGGLMVFVGCGSSAPDVRNPISLGQSPYRDKLTADPLLSKSFLACLAQVRDEKQMSTESAIEPVRALIQRIRERSSSDADSLLPLEDLSADLIKKSLPRFDLAALQQVVMTIHHWHNQIGIDEEDLLRDTSRFARLLLAYNKAYFGDLRFIADQSTPAGSARRVLRITSNGFVDRSGTAFLFPGLSGQPMPVSGSPTVDSGGTVTSQRVSADLTRIFLEAFFDAAFEVPAIHGATALRVEWASEDRPYPEFRADHPAVTPDAMARITRDALRTEAAVTTEVGKAVRGGSGAGTGNETLAAAVETAAGVTAKKLVEHEGFCYFQVKQGTN